MILLPHTCDFLNFTTLRSINALILIIYPSTLVSVLILLLYIYKTINLLEIDLLLYLNLALKSRVRGKIPLLSVF